MTIKRILVEIKYLEALAEEATKSENKQIWIDGMKTNIEKLKTKLLENLPDKEITND